MVGMEVTLKVAYILYCIYKMCLYRHSNAHEIIVGSGALGIWFSNNAQLIENEMLPDCCENDKV